MRGPRNSASGLGKTTLRGSVGPLKYHGQSGELAGRSESADACSPSATR